MRTACLPSTTLKLLKALRLPPLELFRRAAELPVGRKVPRQDCLLHPKASVQGLGELCKLVCWATGQTLWLHKSSSESGPQHSTARYGHIQGCCCAEVQHFVACPACRHCKAQLPSCKTCSQGPQTDGCRTVWPRRFGSLAFRASPSSTCCLVMTSLLQHNLLPSDQHCGLSHSGS